MPIPGSHDVGFHRGIRAGERNACLCTEQAAFSAWCETQWQPIANTASQALRQIGEGWRAAGGTQSLSGHLFRQGLYLEKACFLAPV
jgi:hypothetical protein